MSELFGFLYAEPSFIEGVARILDFGNTLAEYNHSSTPEQADALALSADWRVVGCDLEAAMSQVEEEYQENRADAQEPR